MSSTNLPFSGGALSSVTPGRGSCLFPSDSEADPSPAPALLSCLARAESPAPAPLVVTSCAQRSERPGAGLSLSRLVFQSRTTSFVGHSLFPQTEAEAASTALLVAAFNGKEDRVKELLSREDTNPNVSYSNGKVLLVIYLLFTKFLHLLRKHSSDNRGSGESHPDSSDVALQARHQGEHARPGWLHSAHQSLL